MVPRFVRRRGLTSLRRILPSSARGKTEASANQAASRSRARRAAFGWFLLTLALVGCGSMAAWKTVDVASSYQPPRTVTLKVSQSPAGDEALTLEMALVSAFAEHDVHAIPLDDAKSRPSLRVVIENGIQVLKKQAG